MFNCFNRDADFGLFDKAAFKFSHRLMGHPALSMENIANVLPRLKDRVVYSGSPFKLGDDFEGSFKNRQQEKPLEEIIDTLQVSNSYIMVSGPEVDPSFFELYREMLDDVESVMCSLRLGKQAIDAKLFLFIASPNSVTPFHIDRFSTFLFQFRGSKTVSVFPQWAECAVSSASREAYVAYSNTKLPFSPEIDALGTEFNFSPGEALHIPFIAGHHVKNGPGDVSISMSIIFNTSQSIAWRQALRFNFTARKLYKKIGMQPSPIGQSFARDLIKAKAWSAFSSVRGH